jgi:hypothetical protein
LPRFLISTPLSHKELLANLFLPQLSVDKKRTANTHMTLFPKLRNILTGRARKWGNTNNVALTILTTEVQQVMAESPEIEKLFIHSLVASHLTIESLVLNNAPSAILPIPFSSLTVERMHQVHCRGLEMFSTMFLELNRVGMPPAVFGDMLRSCCTPSKSSTAWQNKVSDLCGQPKFDILPISKGFIDEIALIIPEAAPTMITAVSGSVFISGYYSSTVRDCIPHTTK